MTYRTAPTDRDLSEPEAFEIAKAAAADRRLWFGRDEFRWGWSYRFNDDEPRYGGAIGITVTRRGVVTFLPPFPYSIELTDDVEPADAVAQREAEMKAGQVREPFWRRWFRL